MIQITTHPAKALILVLIVFLVTTGCTATSHQSLEATKPALIGLHIDELVAALGMPSTTQVVGTRKYYSWTNNTQYTQFVYGTNDTTTTGNVGSSNVNLVTKTKKENLTHKYECTFNASVDSKERVVSSHHSGNNHACWRFANRLKKLRS